MTKEHNLIINERNKQYEKTDPDMKDREEKEITDFKTGKRKNIKRVKSLRHRGVIFIARE